MKNYFKSIFILLAFCAFQFAIAQEDPFEDDISTIPQIPANALKMMDWEYEHNPATKAQLKVRHKKNFTVEFYEIPEEFIQASILPGTKQELIDSIKFERFGKTYYRWFINPEDTVYHQEVERFLQANNISSHRYPLGEGRLSASRSSLAINQREGDKGYGTYFYYKTSTNKTGGDWKLNKNVDEFDQKASFLVAHLSRKIKRKFSFENLETLAEPISLLLKGEKNGVPINQGLILRSLGNSLDQGHYLLPGFTVLDEKEGPRIARLDTNDPDSNDPSEYWRKHYAAPLGAAMGELAATHGLFMSSSHSQQYLIELDANFIPTGKILVRDFNDSSVADDFYSDASDEPFLEVMANNNEKIISQLKIWFGLFHGTPRPSWLSNNDVKLWSQAFFENFQRKFSEMSGINQSYFVDEDNYSIKNMYDGCSYGNILLTYIPPYMKRKSANKDDDGPDYSDDFERWYSLGRCLRGKKTLSNGAPCVEVLSCYKGDQERSKGGFLCKEVMGLIYQFDRKLVKKYFSPKNKKTKNHLLGKIGEKFNDQTP